MKGAAVLLVLTGAFAMAMASAPADYCGPEGLPGGWTEIVPSDSYTLTSYMDLAVETYIAGNGTIACPDSYDTTLVAGCSQVVAGMNYKLLFSVGCEAAADVLPADLEATIYVPLPPNQEAVEVEVAPYGEV